ncbi:CEBPN [Lepeophtheirus salmonis]|uniref:CEBPN n=1 Tax=Lepeophtheirus salmonis TaxID=72036 RepID=A0A7R8H5P4_LEPSM|nr:CEBPN [Lepeophtheirus salmonis]CAF2881422.1 CEBPN [Lepeophtheirus salmonis]
METSTGGGGIKCSINHPSSGANSHSVSNNNSNNNGVSSSMLKIRQLHSGSPPLNHHHSLMNAGGGHDQLTELTSSDISMDLQGLIDDSQFEDESIFGDLMDGKKNAVDLINNNSLNELLPQTHSEDPLGSLHRAQEVILTPIIIIMGGTHWPTSLAQCIKHPIHPMSNVNLNHQSSHPVGHDIRVKQEPAESAGDFGSRGAGYNGGAGNNNSSGNNNNSSGNNSNAPYSNGTVSSTTPSPPSAHLYMGDGGSPHKGLSSSSANNNNSSNPSGNTKYIHANHSSSPNSNLGSPNSLLPILKKKTAIGERCSDEYRRRRERNNVAVRKSREKAKIRTRETEERVKILARENERLQKKVETPARRTLCSKIPLFKRWSPSGSYP